MNANQKNTQKNSTESTSTKSTSKKSFWKTWGKTIVGLSLVVIVLVATFAAPTFGIKSSTSPSSAIADMYGIDTGSDENPGTILDSLMDAAGLTDKINGITEDNMEILEGFTNKVNSDYIGQIESSTGVDLPPDVLTAQDANKYLAESGRTRNELIEQKRELCQKRDSLSSKLNLYIARGDSAAYDAAVARIAELQTQIDEIEASIDALNYKP